MHACMHILMYVCMYVCMYVYKYVGMYMCMHPCGKCVHTHVCMCGMYGCMHPFMDGCTHDLMCMFVSQRTYVYVCLQYVYNYIDR
jgi:hypothetical protein